MKGNFFLHETIIADVYKIYEYKAFGAECACLHVTALECVCSACPISVNQNSKAGNKEMKKQQPHTQSHRSSHAHLCVVFNWWISKMAIDNVFQYIWYDANADQKHYTSTNIFFLWCIEFLVIFVSGFPLRFISGGTFYCTRTHTSLLAHIHVRVYHADAVSLPLFRSAFNRRPSETVLVEKSAFTTVKHMESYVAVVVYTVRSTNACVLSFFPELNSTQHSGVVYYLYKYAYVFSMLDTTCGRWSAWVCAAIPLLVGSQQSVVRVFHQIHIIYIYCMFLSTINSIPFAHIPSR